MSKNKVKWSINCCAQCRRPYILHEDPWIEECAVEPMKQDLKGEYIDKLESNKRIKQIAKSMEPDPEEETEDETDEDETPRTPRTTRTRTRTSRDDKSHNKSKFPLWKEKTRCSEYELMKHWHRRTSKKDAENQFMDLVNALIDSTKKK